MENEITEIGRFLDFLADAILIVDQRSNIVFANNSCVKLFGYSKETFKDLSLHDLMPAKSVSQHDEKVATFIKNKSSARVMMSRNIMPCINALGKEFNARISIANIEFKGEACGIATIQDYSTVQDIIDELSNEASTDALTGLFNKRHLENILSKEYLSVNGGSLWGIAYLDLNGFKAINDTHGHDVGDALLIEVAQRLSSEQRTGDLSFRIGGDEFLLLFSLSGQENYPSILKEFGDKVYNLINKPIEIDKTGLKLSVGVSIGIGAMPYDEKDLSALIKKTDKAMYQSKFTGAKYVLVSEQAKS